MIPHAIIFDKAISQTDIRVLLALMQYPEMKKPNSQIANEIGVSRRTLQRSISIWREYAKVHEWFLFEENELGTYGMPNEISISIDYEKIPKDVKTDFTDIGDLQGVSDGNIVTRVTPSEGEIMTRVTPNCDTDDTFISEDIKRNAGIHFPRKEKQERKNSLQPESVGVEHDVQAECKVNLNQTISEICDLFNARNPAVHRGMTTQRAAIQTLINKYGVDEVRRLTVLALDSLGKSYAPVIDTPIKLLHRVVQLLAFEERNKRREVTEFEIVGPVVIG